MPDFSAKMQDYEQTRKQDQRSYQDYPKNIERSRYRELESKAGAWGDAAREQVTYNRHPVGNKLMFCPAEPLGKEKL